MIIKMGKFGKFLACPGFPDCRNTKPLLEKVEDVVCPKCQSDVLIKKTKNLDGKGMSVKHITSQGKNLEYTHESDVLWIQITASAEMSAMKQLTGFHIWVCRRTSGGT